MDALRCPPGDSDVSTLSGGEIRRVALCRLLLNQAHLPPRRRVRRRGQPARTSGSHVLGRHEVRQRGEGPPGGL